jgi:parallel beta-helix repeat protein
MLALASILVLMPIAGRAQVPQTISYQGSLSDAKGNPLSATVEMVFRLYASPTVAIALWSEVQKVSVQNGTFSVVLGANALNPLDAARFKRPLYLGIAVGTDAEMTPRQALTAVGYAMRAKTVESDTLSALGCAPGQIASWNGSAWACAADNTGGVASDLVCATCVSTGELAFDTATQPELDGHGATAGAHHSRYTNAEAVAAAGPHVSSVDGLSGGTVTSGVAVSGTVSATGLAVSSTGLVANLNADRVDGLQAAEIVAAAADEVRTPISALPFTISAPGSYYVTGDLTLASTTSHGITVTADNVTIDLMGFSLIGPGSGTGDGIFMNGRSNVEVRNGTLRGFGRAGIYEVSSAAGKQHRVINVRVHANTSYGMRLLGDGHIVKDCTAGGNGSTGLNIGLGATVTGNTAYNNGTGIFAAANSVVTHNTARANSGSGINAGTGSIIMHNTASNNGGFGIGTGDGSTVAGNTADSNDGIGIWVWGATVTNNTARANNQSDSSAGGGIRVDGDSLVKGNTLRGNLQNNIVVASSDNAVEENLVIDSTNGINFTAAGNFFANNRASGNVANYAGSVPTGASDGGGNVGF